jgi:HAD superfamily hydrolase (TIGR01509 family)
VRVTLPLEAVLWDLDGTLVDSEHYWIRTELEIAEEHGATWREEDGLASVGQPLPVTATMMIERGVRSTVAALCDELLARMQALVRAHGVPYRPGTRALIEELSAAGIRQALVTMSFGGYVEAVVEGTPPGTFATVRTGDSVARGKPDPQIYHDAVAALGLVAGQCLAIEDSPSGVGAILAAGVTPVAVPFMVDLPFHERLVVLESLAGVGVEHLAVIHRQWQGAGPRGAR